MQVIGVDVVQAGVGIKGLSAPFCTSVEAGKHHGLLLEASRNKSCLTAEALELFERPLPRSGVRLVSRSAVSNCRANGAGFVGTGCVSLALSPGTVVGGNFRSSIGNNGSPVARSKTKRKPCFVAWATASNSTPAAPDSHECRWRGEARSHRSCRTNWIHACPWLHPAQ